MQPRRREAAEIDAEKFNKHCFSASVSATPAPPRLHFNQRPARCPCDMIKQNLHDNWSVRAVNDLSEVPAEVRDETIRAQVPGCIHTDLMRAGKIPDPYLDLNEY